MVSGSVSEEVELALRVMLGRVIEGSAGLDLRFSVRDL